MPQPYKSNDPAIPPELANEVFDAFSHCVETAEIDRQSFLARLTKVRPDIAVHVLELLESHYRQPDFLDQPAIDQLRAVSPASTPTLVTPLLKRKLTLDLLVPRSPFSWLFLLASFAGLFFHIFAIALIGRYGNFVLDNGWEGVWNGVEIRVTKIEKQGAAAGKLLVEDRIVAVNGDAGRSAIAMLMTWAPFRHSGRVQTRCSPQQPLSARSIVENYRYRSSSSK